MGIWNGSRNPAGFDLGDRAGGRANVRPPSTVGKGGSGGGFSIGSCEPPPASPPG